jgi:hypothetical protein
MVMCNFFGLFCWVSLLQSFNSILSHMSLCFYYHFQANGNMQFFWIICVKFSCHNLFVNFVLGHMSLYNQRCAFFVHGCVLGFNVIRFQSTSN